MRHPDLIRIDYNEFAGGCSWALTCNDTVVSSGWALTEWDARQEALAHLYVATRWLTGTDEKDPKA